MISITKIINDLIGLLLPDLCNGCGTQLFHGEKLICTECLIKIPYTDHHLFPDNKTEQKFWGRLKIESGISMLHFKKGTCVQNLIHSLKYKNKPDLGVLLGQLLGEKLKHVERLKDVDLIIPVPLHKKRAAERGYNQSECIADGISETLRIAISSDNLIRISTTESQTRKGKFERYENMSGVFLATSPTELNNKHILLVDDVITTGATLEACGLELLKHDIKKLSIAAIATTD